MRNKTIFAFAIVFLVGLVSLIGVLAYKGNPDVKGPNYNAEVQAQLEQAIDNKDYDAWLNIRQDNNLPMNGRMFQVVNKDNFAKFSDMHEAMQAGDSVKANLIKEELGLGKGMMKGKGMGNGMNGLHSEKNQRKSGLIKANFIDTNKDGICDNYALHHQ